MFSESEKQRFRKYMDDRLASGVRTAYYYCNCCKQNALHVFDGPWVGKNLWTCSICGSSFLKNK